MKKTKYPLILLCSGLIILVIGCQGVFTFAPFGGLADDPAKMGREQLITYGWDVIASGDSAKMSDALAAVMAKLMDNPTDKDLSYIGANLSLAISKAAKFFTSPPYDVPTLDAYKASINIPMIEQAGALYAVSLINGAALNPTDNIFATIGLLLPTTADDFDQLFVLTAPLTPTQTGYFTAFYAAGITALGGPGNPTDLAIRAAFFPLAP